MNPITEYFKGMSDALLYRAVNELREIYDAGKPLSGLNEDSMVNIITKEVLTLVGEPAPQSPQKIVNERRYVVTLIWQEAAYRLTPQL
jgi:hypothetical protein